MNCERQFFRKNKSFSATSGALAALGECTWDRANAINHGVLHDELGIGAGGVRLQRATCQAPDTGELRVLLAT